MAEREAEQKRIVVETPSERREEVYTQATRYPEERRGVSWSIRRGPGSNRRGRGCAGSNHHFIRDESTTECRERQCDCPATAADDYSTAGATTATRDCSAARRTRCPATGDH